MEWFCEGIGKDISLAASKSTGCRVRVSNELGPVCTTSKSLSASSTIRTSELFK